MAKAEAIMFMSLSALVHFVLDANQSTTNSQGVLKCMECKGDACTLNPKPSVDFDDVIILCLRILSILMTRL